MKTFVCILVLAAVAVAEPPFRQYRQFRFQRQELESEPGPDSTTSRSEQAPYAPAGFRPSKEFNLPSRQEVSPPSTSYGIPDDSYGAPLKTYTAPQMEYGVPEKSPETEYGAPENSEVEQKEEAGEEKEGSGKEEEKVEGDKEKLQEEPKKDAEAEVVSGQGVYYVLLPGAQLQRVQFQTENDIRNMAYTARLQYKNEDRAPVYVYSAVPQYQSAAYVQLF